MKGISLDKCEYLLTSYDEACFKPEKKIKEFKHVDFDKLCDNGNFHIYKLNGMDPNKFIHENLTTSILKNSCLEKDAYEYMGKNICFVQDVRTTKPCGDLLFDMICKIWDHMLTILLIGILVAVVIV